MQVPFIPDNSIMVCATGTETIIFGSCIKGLIYLAEATLFQLVRQ